MQTTKLTSNEPAKDQNVKTNEDFTVEDLLKRGWTRTLIDYFLGTEDYRNPSPGVEWRVQGHVLGPHRPNQRQRPGLIPYFEVRVHIETRNERANEAGTRAAREGSWPLRRLQRGFHRLEDRGPLACRGHSVKHR